MGKRQSQMGMKDMHTAVLKGMELNQMDTLMLSLKELANIRVLRGWF